MRLHRYFCSKPLRLLMCFALLGTFSDTFAQGSLYLPLHMAPEIEAKIEKAFVLSGTSFSRRPFNVKQVNEALERLGPAHSHLRNSIRLYLRRFERTASLNHASMSGSWSDGVNSSLANQRGADTESDYAVSASAHWTPSDWLAINVGGTVSEKSADEKDEFPEGTYISTGWQAFQIDIGYRAHWMSPFQESAMLVSTNGAAFPSVTVSNNLPLDIFGLGVGYEMFVGRLSKSDGIESGTNPPARVSGHPKILGMHLSTQPINGFSLAYNRVMQFGGGDRSENPSDVLNALIDAKRFDNSGTEGKDFGNQLSSFTSRYTSSEGFPFAVYMEFAGEDTSKTSKFHLGNSAVMFGLHLPQLSDTFDLTYEYADWQNGWYVNSNYSDGFTNYQAVLGHWAAQKTGQYRNQPTTSQTIKLIWTPWSGHQFRGNFRSIEVNHRTEINSENGYEVELEYSTHIQDLLYGLTLLNGQTILGEDYSKASFFVRW